MRDPSTLNDYIQEVKRLSNRCAAFEAEKVELNKAITELRDKIRSLEADVRTKSD